MKYHEYLTGVNRTWKKDDGLKQLTHCQFAIVEEVGEIFGWYKRHYGYGQERDAKWQAEFVGELGDLLFYITKTADLAGFDIELYYEDDYSNVVPTVEPLLCNVQPLMVRMMDTALILNTAHIVSNEFQGALLSLIEDLHQVIKMEGFDLEEVQIKNLAKLSTRHGNSFNEKAIHEEGRNREEESKALNGNN